MAELVKHNIKDHKNPVEAILRQMKHIHNSSDAYASDTYDKTDLLSVYQECIDHCPKGETMIIETLKLDLLRISEYEHVIPDLLSSITRKRIGEHYGKKKLQD